MYVVPYVLFMYRCLPLCMCLVIYVSSVFVLSFCLVLYGFIVMSFVRYLFLSFLQG